MRYTVNNLFSLLLVASSMLTVFSSCDDDMETMTTKPLLVLQK